MRWPPFKHVFFDCDSTLTTVEGIDVLADMLGKGWRVSVLTDAAMNGEVDLEEVYSKRLRALQPTRGQIQAIRRVYKQNVVQDGSAVISALKDLGHHVYIISGGLAEPVAEFGMYLGVPREHIRAVEIEYDALAGKWWRQNQNQPNVAERYLNHSSESLTISTGKARIIQELLGGQTGRSLLIGDGVSDLLASQAVDLFVGFGGVVSRTRVRREASLFIDGPSIAPLLTVAAGPAALVGLLGSAHEPLIVRSMDLTSNGAVTFRNERLKSKFDAAFQSAYQTVHSGPN